MAFAAKSAPLDLPREMQRHTYAILYELEETHWWYRGRRQILESFLSRIVAQFPTPDSRLKLLDVGCGTGGNMTMLNQFGDAHGIDVSEDAIKFCRERGLDLVRLGAAEELPYEPATFDVVTALDVVEHLDDDVGGLKQMHRVLKPDGRVLIFVPAFMFLWGVQDDVSNHRRRYRLPQLLDVLNKAGFEVERSSYANLTFFLPILAVRTFMRWFNIKTSTELTIGVSRLNRPFGWAFGAERHLLKHIDIPFGVSAVCVAKKAA